MKKILCLLVACLGLTFAQAQSTRIGLKGGLTYSNIAGDLENESIYQNKLGFNGGITANFPVIGNFLSIQPEILYNQKGYQYQDEEFTFLGITRERKGKRNFNYIDVPVLAKINAGGIFFEAGPQISYLLGVRDNTEETINGIENKNYQRINKDDLAELEIGYAVGLGFQASNGVSLGVRYNGSVQDLAKNTGNDELTNARHSAFLLQLGFPISGGSK
ncbi:porin family protein [Adhaeribacter aquaticus]|uniref:porin family protein n=1 Tax=Adhaeribacter aquaticus TaxID=299567 RepID=UPI0003FC6D8C|nr:porin family protein [Adhaeribacter aquaticus]